MAKTNKALQVGDLVLRPQGATRKEILAALGWKEVNVYDEAKKAGIGIVSIKRRGPYQMRYYGIPKGALVTLIDMRSTLVLR